MSSICKAIERAYQIMAERNWDTVYWAIDLHGVVFNSTYQRGGYEFINDTCEYVLKRLSARPECKIILWSSCHPEEQEAIMSWFYGHGIDIFAFNENPEVQNTRTGCFDEKFYMSVLLDDKAGFDPETDWAAIAKLLML